MPGAAEGAAPSAGRQWPIFIVEPGSDCTARSKAGGRGNVSPGAGSGRGSEPGVGAGRRQVDRSTSDSAGPPDHRLYQPARTWAAVDTLMQGFCWRGNTCLGTAECRVGGILVGGLFSWFDPSSNLLLSTLSLPVERQQCQFPVEPNPVCPGSGLVRAPAPVHEFAIGADRPGSGRSRVFVIV